MTLGDSNFHKLKHEESVMIKQFKIYLHINDENKRNKLYRMLSEKKISCRVFRLKLLFTNVIDFWLAKDLLTMI